MVNKYNPARLTEGLNTAEGEEIFYISNPALGLWANREGVSRTKRWSAAASCRTPRLMRGTMKDKADIGMIGLAVMGENLALNMESKGFTVAVYNRTVPESKRASWSGL